MTDLTKYYYLIESSPSPHLILAPSDEVLSAVAERVAELEFKRETIQTWPIRISLLVPNYECVEGLVEMRIGGLECVGDFEVARCISFCTQRLSPE